MVGLLVIASLTEGQREDDFLSQLDAAWISKNTFGSVKRTNTLQEIVFIGPGKLRRRCGRRRHRHIFKDGWWTFILEIIKMSGLKLSAKSVIVPVTEWPAWGMPSKEAKSSCCPRKGTEYGISRPQNGSVNYDLSWACCDMTPNSCQISQRKPEDNY